MPIDISKRFSNQLLKRKMKEKAHNTTLNEQKWVLIFPIIIIISNKTGQKTILTVCGGESPGLVVKRGGS